MSYLTSNFKVKGQGYNHETYYNIITTIITVKNCNYDLRPRAHQTHELTVYCRRVFVILAEIGCS